MDYLKGLLAGPEMAMSLGSGLLAQPLSGLAGLLALPAGAERAANAVRATQERLTYQPQTDGGQRMVGALGGLMAPVGQAFEAARRVSGDAGYAVGGPLGGAIGSALPDALSMVPMGALFRGLRGAPQRFPLPNQAQAGAIYYHGSSKPFESFDMNAPKATDGGFIHHGVSLSSEPKVAQRYADDFSVGAKPGYVYKVDADVKNPLNLDQRDFHYLQERVRDMRYGKKLNEVQQVWVEDMLNKHGIKWDGTGDPIDAIKSAGFDAINNVAHKRGGGFYEAETLVFDPQKIKILDRKQSGLLGAS